MIDFSDLDAAIEAKKARDDLTEAVSVAQRATDLRGGNLLVNGAYTVDLSSLAASCGFERQEFAKAVANLLLGRANERLDVNTTRLTLLGVRVPGRPGDPVLVDAIITATSSDPLVQ